MKPCHARSRRCYDATSHGALLRECCRGHVRTIMTATAEALDAVGATWWADYGTLLGAVRNPITRWADYPWLPQSDEPIAPGIVPHDKDGDLGVLASDWATTHRALRLMCLKKGYSILIRPNRGSMKVRLSRFNRTNVDVFFWHERPDGMLYRKAYAGVDAYKGKEFHRDMLVPLTTVEWEGLTLPAPKEPEAFLEMRYGDSWMTPVPANHDGVRRDQEAPA